MEKKKNHTPKDDQLRKEIEDVLNQDESLINLEPLPGMENNPFLQSVAKIPTPPVDFYFSELLSWMHNGYQSIKHEISTNKDSIIRHIIFPPESEYARTEPAPYTEEYDHITIEDLNLQQTPAKERIFDKSPALQVFLLTILESIQSHPGAFIKTYAEQRSINKLLEDDDYHYSGEQKCIELLTLELETYLHSTSHQLIPTLYHFHGHGIVMSSNIHSIELDKIDFRTEPEETWEFQFSKTTSDNFTRQLIRILQLRKELIHKLNKASDPNNKSPEQTELDTRINCKGATNDIKNYFLKLSQKNEDGFPILKEEEITHLLQANFTNFALRTNIKKITPNLNQANLRYFIYQFFLKYSKTTHEADVYARLLKNNFTQFENTEIDVIKKSFSKKPAKYPDCLM